MLFRRRPALWHGRWVQDSTRGWRRLAWQRKSSLHDPKEYRRLLPAKGRRYQIRLSPITHRLSMAPTG